MSHSELDALRAVFASRPKPKDIAEMRQNIDARGLAYGVSSDVTVEVTDAGGVKAEWTRTANADPQRAILYVHGGGYVIGSLDSHRHSVSEIGRAAGARMLALDYRLAPEYPFPAPIEDTLAGYRHLIAQGLKPGNIAIAGDSAGLPQPACGWAISPWVDMEAIGGSMTSKAGEDPNVQKDGIAFMAKSYLNGADPRHPLAAPLYADLTGIAPLLIQVGAAETLLDDSVRLAGVAGAAHVPVTLEIWPEMIHVWHNYHPSLTAGRRAIERGGAYVKAIMDGNPPIDSRAG
jgi:monoterpene epsilon-lactone hydrolase